MIKKIEKITNTKLSEIPELDNIKYASYIHPKLWLDTDPFLMFDYIPSQVISPRDTFLGVEAHPHKGFETITILWEGELKHEDSITGVNKVNAGDVQWMTAGKGFIHKEQYDEEFLKKGGKIHSAQLWVNLPSKYKNTKPRYQDIKNQNIPIIQLGGDSYIRVIAGDQKGVTGPAQTFTRVLVLDINLKTNQTTIETINGDNACLIILRGNCIINGDTTQFKEGDMITFEQKGTNIDISTDNELHCVILSGKGIEENIVSNGPIIMNEEEEIESAIQEYQRGDFGILY